MALNRKWIATRVRGNRGKWWNGFAIAVLSFAAGSFVTLLLMNLKEVRAESSRVYELDIYHATPGKVPLLEDRFRDASKLQAKHGLNAVGYWVPQDKPAFANTFIYMIVHSSREDAVKNWHEFHADPAFQAYVKAEQANPLIESVDQVLMRPTDYSAMK